MNFLAWLKTFFINSSLLICKNCTFLHSFSQTKCFACRQLYIPAAAAKSVLQSWWEVCNANNCSTIVRVHVALVVVIV
jgi:hypothetical protein